MHFIWLQLQTKQKKQIDSSFVVCLSVHVYLYQGANAGHSFNGLLAILDKQALCMHKHTHVHTHALEISDGWCGNNGYG